MPDSRSNYSTRKAGAGTLLSDVDEDTEHSLLSCLTHTRVSRRDISLLPSPSDFANEMSRSVFAAMLLLLEKHGRIDPSLFFKAMREQGVELGNDYFRNLRSVGAHPENITEYASIIHSLAVRRRMKEFGIQVAEKASRHTGDPNELLGAVQALLQDTYRENTTGRSAGDLVSFHDALDVAWDKIENPDSVKWMSTGIRSLDYAIGGLLEGELVVIAALSAGGKTSLEMQIVLYTAAFSSKRWLIVSKEMTPDQLALRVLLMRANVNGLEIRRARLDGTGLSAATWKRLRDARDELEKLRGPDGRSHVMIVPPGHTSAQSICSMIRREKAEYGLDAFAIDYLQILDAPLDAKASENEELRLRLDSQAFKDLAMEERLIGIMLSQLAKQQGSGVAGKDGSVPRPHMSHLKGSQGVQAAADLILLLHRPNPPTDSDATLGYPVNCIIAKGRNQGDGDVELDFEPAFTRFSDRARVSDDNPPHPADEAGGNTKW